MSLPGDYTDFTFEMPEGIKNTSGVLSPQQPAVYREPMPSPGGRDRAAPTPIFLDPSKLTVTGGLAGLDEQLLIPMYDWKNKQYHMMTFDPFNFNTEEEAMYVYKQEDVMSGRHVTISRVRLLYRDIGKATIKVGISTAQAVKERELTIGGKADGMLRTAYADILISGERPQLYISKEADSGPLSIVRAELITNIEIAEQV